MYTERKIHTGFISTLFVVAVLVLLMFHTGPAQSTTRDLTARRDTLKHDVETIASQQQGSGDGSLSEVEAKELAERIPQKLEQDIIVSDINKMAKAADVNFNALTFSLQKKSALPTVNISAGFQGPAANLTRFLSMIEKNQRKFVIKDASISRSTSSGGVEVVQLNLNIESYYQTL